MDVRSTKDHKPILVYDQDLSRLCHLGRFTQEFNFKDLPPIKATEIDIPYVLDPKTGHSILYNVTKKDSKKISSLEELLKALDKADPEKKKWLNIQFQDGDMDSIEEAYNLI